MLEQRGQAEIVGNMKEHIAQENSEIDTREGSLIHTAISPVAFELMQANMDMQYVLRNTNPNTCDREYLVYLCNARGLEPKPATRAMYKINPDAHVSRGVTGVCNGIKLTFIDGTTCETEDVGTKVNNLLDYKRVILDNGYTVMLDSLYIPAEDEENTENLRKRYFQSFRGIGFAGNKKAYQDKAMEHYQVGICAVERVSSSWYATVNIHVLSKNFKPLPSSVIEEIQKDIDPYKDGEGNGWCPIGSAVTVQNMSYTTVNLVYDITLNTGYSMSTITNQLFDVINDYFIEYATDYFNSSRNPNLYGINTDRIESYLLTKFPEIKSCTIWNKDNKKTNDFTKINDFTYPKLVSLTAHTSGDGLQ